MIFYTIEKKNDILSVIVGVEIVHPKGQRNKIWRQTEKPATRLVVAAAFVVVGIGFGRRRHRSWGRMLPLVHL